MKINLLWAKKIAASFITLFQIFLLSILIFSFFSNAQSLNSLRGTIVDSTDGSPLLGANVILTGTGFGAAANLDGKYRITNIPNGNYTIVISYIGYESKSVKITLSGGKNYDVSAKLSPATVLGKEVIVTAQLKGQAEAINQQINSNTIVNVVSADKIRELPDANAAESIGRLPGISLTRSGGEATKVVIRGLEPKFNAVDINGVRVPSNDLDDRSVDLSMISSDILNGIEVYKSAMPDMDAENIGGVINLKIRKAPKERNIRVKLSGDYGNLKTKYHGPNGLIEYSDRFFNSSLGVEATANYEAVDRSGESFSGNWQFVSGLRDPVTGELHYRGNTITINNTEETRKRYGGGLTLDYDLHNGTIWLTNFFSSTNRNIFSFGKNYNPPQDQLGWNLNDREVRLTGFSSSLNGELNTLGMNIDWVVSRYYVASQDLYNWSMNWGESTPFNISILDPYDPSTYQPAEDNKLDKITLGGVSFSPDSSEQTNYAAALNTKIPFNIGKGIAGFIKVGGKFLRADRNRGNITKGKNTYYQGGSYTTETQKYWNKPLILVNRDKISIENFLGSYTDKLRIVNGEYDLFPLVSRDISREWYNQQKPSFLTDQFQVINNYDLTETVSAGYIMANFNFGQFLTVIPGVRYEYSNNRYSSFNVNAHEGLGGAYTVTDTTRKIKYGYFFPHLHIKVQPLSWSDLRFSVTRSIARPNYNWVTPWTELRVSTASIKRGNPDLKETTSWNYDVSLSVYDNSFGLFTISGFYKELKNISYPKESKVFKPEDIEALKIPGHEGGYTMNSYANSPHANVRGVELDLQTHFSVLPGIPDFLRGFVFNVNYARIWSETYFPAYDFNVILDYSKYPPGVSYSYSEYERKGPMPGQAKQVGNMSLGYDIAGLSARISLIYQGSSLRSVGTIPENDSYNDAYWRWDASVRYRITSQLSLLVNLVNITGQPDRAFIYNDNYPTNRTYYGMEASASVEFNLN
jgi:TonB-dependent receptor